MGSPDLDTRASCEKVHPGRSLRVCVIAHHSRAAGGQSSAQNMIAALGRAAPQHTYLVTSERGGRLESPQETATNP